MNALLCLLVRHKPCKVYFKGDEEMPFHICARCGIVMGSCVYTYAPWPKLRETAGNSRPAGKGT